MCIMKLHDILRVKNTSVRFVFCITEYTNSNLCFCSASSIPFCFLLLPSFCVFFLVYICIFIDSLSNDTDTSSAYVVWVVEWEVNVNLDSEHMCCCDVSWDIMLVICRGRLQHRRSVRLCLNRGTPEYKPEALQHEAASSVFMLFTLSCFLHPLPIAHLCLIMQHCHVCPAIRIYTCVKSIVILIRCIHNIH
jgi:hypothetical protein